MPINISHVERSFYDVGSHKRAARTNAQHTSAGTWGCSSPREGRNRAASQGRSTTHERRYCVKRNWMSSRTKQVVGKVRKQCEKLVSRRGLLSAGASVIPIPGMDI